MLKKALSRLLITIKNNPDLLNNSKLNLKDI